MIYIPSVDPVKDSYKLMQEVEDILVRRNIGRNVSFNVTKSFKLYEGMNNKKKVFTEYSVNYWNTDKMEFTYLIKGVMCPGDMHRLICYWIEANKEDL